MTFVNGFDFNIYDENEILLIKNNKWKTIGKIFLLQCRWEIKRDWMLVTSGTFLNGWVGYFTWSQCCWTGTIGHGLPPKASFIFNILFATIEWKWVDIDWWFKIQRMWWSFKIALWGADPVSSELQAGWLSPEQSNNCPCTITHSRCLLPTQRRS